MNARRRGQRERSNVPGAQNMSHRNRKGPGAHVREDTANRIQNATVCPIFSSALLRAATFLVAFAILIAHTHPTLAFLAMAAVVFVWLVREAL
jgi:Flp pilus assembly protein TadB